MTTKYLIYACCRSFHLMWLAVNSRFLHLISTCSTSYAKRTCTRTLKYCYGTMSNTLILLLHHHLLFLWNNKWWISRTWKRSVQWILSTTSEIPEIDILYYLPITVHDKCLSQFGAWGECLYTYMQCAESSLHLPRVREIENPFTKHIHDTWSAFCKMVNWSRKLERWPLDVSRGDTRL